LVVVAWISRIKLLKDPCKSVWIRGPVLVLLAASGPPTSRVIQLPNPPQISRIYADQKNREIRMIRGEVLGPG